MYAASSTLTDHASRPIVPPCFEVLKAAEAGVDGKQQALRSRYNFGLTRLCPEIFSIRQTAVCRLLDVTCLQEVALWMLALDDYLSNTMNVDLEAFTRPSYEAVDSLVELWSHTPTSEYRDQFIASRFRWEAHRFLSLSLVHCGCLYPRGGRGKDLGRSLME